MKKSLAIILALLASPGPGKSSEVDGAWLQISEKEGLIQIEVYAKLEQGISGNYSLEATKVGPSGQSKTRQAGSVPVSNGEAYGPISVSRMSLEPNATLQVVLTVEDNLGNIFEEERKFPERN